jgi:Tfp pilus assembly protein PilE
MGSLSTWSKINLALSLIMILVGVLIPILQESSYKGKMIEAKSVTSNIAQAEDSKFAIEHKYIAIKKAEQSNLNKLNVNDMDLKHYNYIVTTTLNSFEITAEPKIEFIKSREIPVRFYTYKHVFKGNTIEKWSEL